MGCQRAIAEQIIKQKADYVLALKGNHSGMQADNEESLEKSISAFKKGVSSTFKAYSDTGIKVIVMLQVPMQEVRPEKTYYKSLSDNGFSIELLKKNSVSEFKHKEYQSKTNKIINDEAIKYKNIVVIDPLSFLCISGSCPVGNENH